MSAPESPLVVHAVGNAHVDPVWLWGWQEGADEAVSTFRAAVDRCTEYPDFVFTAGEAWRYSLVERFDPALFERIRDLIDAGRWHVVGGQWVQPDCNLPTGDALRAQLARGQSYFRSRFGSACTAGFNPDSFGHPATLPDFLAEAGIRSYCFSRPAPAQLELPPSPFVWCGPGGGEVLVFRIVPIYGTRASELTGSLELALERTRREIGHTMLFYGVGDHGGGPSKAQIEWIEARRRADPELELRFGGMDDYFDAVEPLRATLPVYEGEFQHCFPGCYSVMHDVKQRQRRIEERLVQAEAVVTALDAPRSEHIPGAWDDALFTAFHDILAGTAVESAWGSIRAIQGRAEIVAEEAIYAAVRQRARQLPTYEHPQVVVFNSGTEPWEGLIEVTPWLDFDEWRDRWISDGDGKPTVYQRVDADADSVMTRLLVPARIDAQSFGLWLLRLDESIAPGPLESEVRVEGATLTGKDVAVSLGSSGIEGITRDGILRLGPAGIYLRLRADETDTWTQFGDRYDGPVTDTIERLVWTIEEDGPLRARLRGVGTLGSTAVAWRVTLDAGGRISLDLELNVVESFRALQLVVDLPAPAEHRLEGIPGGVLARPLGPVEWPVQRFSRVTAGGRDVALVTQDASSLSVDSGSLVWTLVRTPRMAWLPFESSRRAFAPHTDQGVHRFTFRLLAEDHIEPAELERTAQEQSRPPIVFNRSEGVTRPPYDLPPRVVWGVAEERRAKHLVETDKRDA